MHTLAAETHAIAADIHTVSVDTRTIAADAQTTATATHTIAIDTHQAEMEVREAIGGRTVSHTRSLYLIEQTLIVTRLKAGKSSQRSTDPASYLYAQRASGRITTSTTEGLLRTQRVG